GWQQLRQQNERTIQEAKRVFSFTAGDITKLSVQQVDAKPTVAVRNDEGEWAITAPDPSIKPNVVLWDRVAEHAAGLLNARSLPEDALALDSYGLDVPRLTVAIE